MHVPACDIYNGKPCTCSDYADEGPGGGGPSDVDGWNVPAGGFRMPSAGTRLYFDGQELPPWQWEWGETADGVSWHARPTDAVDPSQKWRQYLEPRTLTDGECLLAQSHMCGFMRAVDPAYRTWWASDLVADRITQCIRRARGLRGPGTLGAFILRVPPQHLKTYMVEEHAPPFAASQDPTFRIINLCYARSLSKRNVHKWKALMATEPYMQISRARTGRVVDVDGSIERDEQGAHMLRFMVDGGPMGVFHGPGFGFSVGVNSELTGWPGDVGIAGDLVRNPDEAFNPMHRDKLLGRVQSMFFTRLQPASCFMLAMSPWHPSDISYAVQGLAQEAGIDCEVMELPARAEAGACALHPDDPRKPGSGEILDHVRRTVDFYRAFSVLCGRYYQSLGLLAPQNFGPELVDPNAWVTYDPHLLIPPGTSRAPIATIAHCYLSIDTNGDENGESFAHLSVWVAVDLVLGVDAPIVGRKGVMSGVLSLGTGLDQPSAVETRPDWGSGGVGAGNGRAPVGVRRMLWKIGQTAGPWGWEQLRKNTLDIIVAIGTGIICPWTIIVERKALGPALISEIMQAREGRAGDPGLIRKGVKPWTMMDEYPQGSKRARADQCKPYVSFGMVCLPDRRLDSMWCRGGFAGLADISWVAVHKQGWSCHPNPVQGAHDLVDADSQCIRAAARLQHIRLPDGMISPLGLGN